MGKYFNFIKNLISKPKIFAFLLMIIISPFLKADEANQNQQQQQLKNSPQELKIAVIDIEAVASSSKHFIDLKNEIEKSRAEYQKHISKLEAEIIQLDKEISANKGKISEAELKKLNVQLSVKEAEIQRLIQKNKNKLDEKYTHKIHDLNQKLNKLVVDYSKAQNFAILLRKDATIYNNSAVDITESILEQFNKEYRGNNGE
jgi:Skp family chaperone for outer membrane proteins